MPVHHPRRLLPQTRSRTSTRPHCWRRIGPAPPSPSRRRGRPHREPSEAWDGTDRRASDAIWRRAGQRPNCAGSSRWWRAARGAGPGVAPQPQGGVPVRCPPRQGGWIDVVRLCQLWLWTMGTRSTARTARTAMLWRPPDRWCEPRRSASYAEAAYDRDIIALRRAYVETTGTTLELVTALVQAGEVPKVNRTRAIDHHAAGHGQRHPPAAGGTAPAAANDGMGGPRDRLGPGEPAGAGAPEHAGERVVQRALRSGWLAAAQQLVQLRRPSSGSPGSPGSRRSSTAKLEPELGDQPGLFAGLVAPDPRHRYAHLAEALAQLKTATSTPRSSART